MLVLSNLSVCLRPDVGSSDQDAELAMTQTRDQPRRFLDPDLSRGARLAREFGAVTLRLQREIQRYGVGCGAESVSADGITSTVDRATCYLVDDVVFWVLEVG